MALLDGANDQLQYRGFQRGDLRVEFRIDTLQSTQDQLGHLRVVGEDRPDPLQVVAQLGLGRFRALQLDGPYSRADLDEDLMQQRIQYRSLALEVKIEGPAGDTHLLDDVVHRSAVVSLLGKTGTGGIEDTATCLGPPAIGPHGPSIWSGSARGVLGFHHGAAGYHVPGRSGAIQTSSELEELG